MKAPTPGTRRINLRLLSKRAKRMKTMVLKKRKRLKRRAKRKVKKKKTKTAILRTTLTPSSRLRLTPKLLRVRVRLNNEVKLNKILTQSNKLTQSLKGVRQAIVSRIQI